MSAEVAEVEVLRRLSAVTSAVGAFTDPEAACAFVAEALRALPGVSAVAVLAPGAAPADAGAGLVPIRSPRADFGAFLLTLHAPAAYAPYAPVTQTVGDHLGVLLDNLDLHRRLEDANAALARHIHASASHIADRTQALQQANQELHLTRLVMENATEGVVITDTSGKILLVNRAFTAVTGWTAAEAVGQTPRMLRSGLHDAAHYEAMWRALLTTGSWEGEMWNRKRDGEVYPEWLSIAAVRDDAGHPTFYVAHFHDLTEQKRVERRIRHLAEHDALTDLPNRHRARDLLVELVGEASREARRVAVYLVDLDNFRALNDSLGHAAGDVVLQNTADRLRDLLRRGGWVGRHGGDEFLIMSTDLPDRAAVEAYADAIAEAVSRPMDVGSARAVTLSASIGIAMAPEDGEDLDSLVRAADAALAAAKDAGRNNWQFNLHHLGGADADTLELVRLLRGAAERGELDVHYQPQVSMRTGQLVGVEALARWTSPSHGAVPPGRFIPLAERHGLIVALGAWVLRRACATIAGMPATMPPFTLAVNLSAFQFRRADLVARVAETLAETGLAPERLELELTESILLAQPAAVQEQVRQLKALGVRLSIDDFGTGYSSLAYLEQLDVDQLKIDRSFVVGLAAGKRAVPESVVHLGHSLGLQVVAEGVEDAATHAQLVELGCDVGQGWFYGRPVTAERLAAMLRTAGPGA